MKPKDILNKIKKLEKQWKQNEVIVLAELKTWLKKHESDKQC